MSAPPLNTAGLPGYLADMLAEHRELVVIDGKVQGPAAEHLVDYEHAMIVEAARGLRDGRVRVPTAEDRARVAKLEAAGVRGNPFAAGSFNLTAQFRVRALDPEHARTLRAQAEAAGELDPRAIRA